MLYRIEVSPQAQRQLRRFSRSLQEQFGRAIDSLASNPRPSGCVRMEGQASTYRIREGDYRIVYQVRDNLLLILVLKVGNRREVYR
ncbi:type II toxin-antitoxin system RelE family toxin [Candidatus Magnetaquicoccus inordinatus]|uniref:type II toxin-antitoxin system RelE family toxin n=1 Tax=Candidatus Magnetaquicoccus inordinatus TaxID=2496818 RepID=UPI00102B8EAE|nr:type II toxin-antitoxin system RelE/ParE family toxin [Candidatus Magnetaquicoccus inordinatus]